MSHGELGMTRPPSGSFYVPGRPLPLWMWRCRSSARMRLASGNHGGARAATEEVRGAATESREATRAASLLALSIIEPILLRADSTPTPLVISETGALPFARLLPY